MKKRTRIIKAAGMVMLAALLMICGTVGSFHMTVSAAASPASALSAVYGGKGDAVKFTLTLTPEDRAKCTDGNVSLYALPPEAPDDELSGILPIVTLPVSATVTHSMSLTSGGTSLLLMRYQAAYQQSDGTVMPLTPAVSPTNMEAWAQTGDVPFREASSKKGLEIQMLADAQELGVAHTVLNVSAEEFLSENATGVSVSFDGTTCYLSEKPMELLDFKVKTMSEAGIRVYLRLLPTSDFMTDMDRLCTLAHGLSERYTREDALYGFAASYLVGYEVNENLRGRENDAQAVEEYARLFRAVDTAVRTAYPEARLYLPLSNRYQLVEGESYEKNGIIGAKNFLTAFAEVVKRGGDLPYRIALDPYPSDPLLTDFWNDPKALATPDTPYVTMRNIEVLLEQLEDAPLTYQNETRKVLIAEFGVSGEYQSEQETTQAAAIAYAYLKAATDDRVEAIIFHRHVDNDAENQLYYGLWSENAADASMATPHSRKASYRVFKYMDTECVSESSMAQSVTAFAPAVIGASSFEELIPGFTYEKVIGRTLVEAVGTKESVKKTTHLSTLFDFSRHSLFRFYPTDNTAYIEIRDDVLYAQAYYDTPHEYMGVGAFQTTPYSLSHAENMILTLRVDAPEPVSEADVMLRLIGKENGKTIVYEGVARIPTGTKQTVTFHLEGLSGEKTSIDNLKIWTRAADEAVYSGDWSLSLSSVQIAEEKNGAWLMNLLGILILIAGIGVILYVIRFVQLRVRARRYRQVTQERAEKQERRIAEQKEREERRLRAEREARQRAMRAERLAASQREAPVTHQRAQAQRVAKEILPGSERSAVPTRPSGTPSPSPKPHNSVSPRAERTQTTAVPVTRPSAAAQRPSGVTSRQSVTPRQSDVSRPTTTAPQTPAARPGTQRRTPETVPAASPRAVARTPVRTQETVSHPTTTEAPISRTSIRSVSGAPPISKANPGQTPRMTAPTPHPVKSASRTPGGVEKREK